MPLCESLMNEWHTHFCHPCSLTVLSDCSPVSQGLAPAHTLGPVQRQGVTFPLTTTSTGQAITFLSVCPARLEADQIKFQTHCLGGSVVHSSTLGSPVFILLWVISMKGKETEKKKKLKPLLCTSKDVTV